MEIEFTGGSKRKQAEVKESKNMRSKDNGWERYEWYERQEQRRKEKRRDVKEIMGKGSEMNRK